MLRRGKGVKGALLVVECRFLCDGDGVGGNGNGLEIPESGLTFDGEGEDRLPLCAELPLG